ncbi:hypothetical protein [Nocardioides sp. B-3]|nr:hypothetical protein [Nocardioides sp. B-3]
MLTSGLPPAAPVDGDWLVPGALVVVERSVRGPALARPTGSGR